MYLNLLWELKQKWKLFKKHFSEGSDYFSTWSQFDNEQASSTICLWARNAHHCSLETAYCIWTPDKQCLQAKPCSGVGWSKIWRKQLHKIVYVNYTRSGTQYPHLCMLKRRLCYFWYSLLKILLYTWKEWKTRLKGNTEWDHDIRM